jgi:hypothetical protein
MKAMGYHEGDRSDYMAQFAFSTVSYCTPVPRQYDRFGVDFYAHLARKVGRKLVATGRTISIQVKSSTQPILLNKPELRTCLYSQALPFFLAIIEKEDGIISIYTMYTRLIQFWTNRNSDVFIVPAPKPDVPPADGIARIYLGDPIYRRPLRDLEKKAVMIERRQELLRVLEFWARWEQLQLAWKEDNLPLVTWISQYETNVPPNPLAMPHEQVPHLGFPNPNYIDGISTGTVKTVFVFRRFYQHLLENQQIQPDAIALANGMIDAAGTLLQLLVPDEDPEAI